MRFMEEVIAESRPLWDAAAHSDFIEQMGQGTLDKEKFLDYMVQDSLYLRDYARAYAMVLFKSHTMREIQVFYSVLGFVNDHENATRLAYLAQAELTDADVEKIPKKPACAAYTNYLIKIAQEEEIPEILMALMPCMLGYYDVFMQLVQRHPKVLEGYFGPLVRDYIAPGYGESCKIWTDYCEEICKDLDAARREKLKAIFKEASAHELYFWEMAGGKEKMNCNQMVRKNVPLVHCITNYVTVNDVANALLACGGSPIMADDIDEVAEITSISSALVINIGTLNRRTIASMIRAGQTANEKGIPVVLDPVGAGASGLRNEAVGALLEAVNFTVIRGNLSEISFIAGLKANTRGVDASALDSGNDPAAVSKAVAEKFRCVAAITGAVDVVSDGKRLAKIHNGVAQMGKVTGTGCMLSGVIGAYAGACPDAFEGTVAAISSMGIAGELSWADNGEKGTGSLHIGIIDALSRIDDETIEKRGKIAYEG